ncbi:RICIN domain-containing protein [Amycolatopsis sp. FBCC-B4732]|uniref:RICIN domain-containing protein n=1 Tax=Amycolatopsis sp. FBCC-B4732 TaxID=3079339 RepID=UPI001FF6FBB5|nr:RICIN domain-containing protein [Amycolatopsis sp. FBCC-B4732]UOX85898.1 RICIN domain-containing protein [Amycolatopsis sp. FBCC-B4732]
MHPASSPGSRRRRAAVAVAAAVLVSTAAPAEAAPPTSGYTVSVQSTGSWSTPTDSPASPYLDKDGTFYFQQSAALYGATQPREWEFYSGRDFDSFTRNAVSDAVNPADPADRNNDTTKRCNTSPTGVESTNPPSGSSYSQKNFCDLVGTWVDPDTGDWYGLVHNEFTPQPFGDGLHYDAVDYAVSTDQGKTWRIEAHVLTSPYSTKRGDAAAFPNQTYYYGDGDQRLYVDTASGYFYVFYGSRVVDKNGGWKAFYAHAARAPISAKMAPGSWRKWYGGAWTEPGVGGKESNQVPVGPDSATGYTPAAKEYSPANTGTADQQIAAGKMPATSPLFVMDITYNAYLGLYIGEPQAVDQSGNAPQQYYATDDLATQKWYPIGGTGGYHTASWYRWFVDGVNKTGSAVVGKNFRAYCSFGCSGGASGEYVNVSIDNPARAAVPFDPAKTYRIATGDGRVLAQSGSATTSVASGDGSAAQAWSFTGTGDGAYRITNAGSGGLLGVAATSSATRAWGTAPTVTSASGVGQQWFVIPGASGTYRLVNRYSGLVLGMSAARPAETTPVRHWTDTTGSPVGGGRTAAQQTLAITAVGTAPVLTGTHTLAVGGKALDVPSHSTAKGTHLVTWTANGGANQSWTFTAQPDGSYELRNAESGLCADVDGGATTAGAAIIQWTCTGGANQHWKATRQADGTYAFASVHSGLLLTTASTSDGAAVTQQAAADRQHWTLG